MPPVTQVANQAVILERMENLRTDICELVGVTKSLTESFGKFEKDYILAHAEVLSRATAAHARIDIQQEQINIFETRLKDIERLMPFLKAIAYIVTTLSIPATLALIALLWNMLTHQVMIP